MRMTKYIGVAGFLGAGKTTALKRLAGYYTGKALTVGIVTNDQAENLVDTANLGTGGNPVEEVAGGCFCCEFNSLIDSIRQLFTCFLFIFVSGVRIRIERNGYFQRSTA